MSRVGKVPVSIPSGVDVRIEGSRVVVQGPRGELSQQFNSDLRIELADGQIVVSRPTEQPRHRALHGLTRSLLANMVTGVSQGFSKELELVGIGYRAQIQGDKLVLAVGFSRPIEIEPPPGIQLAVESTAKVIVSGIDKGLVGQTAADIRKVRPPEPYKGKGIRYAGEHIRRKAGKTGKAAR